MSDFQAHTLNIDGMHCDACVRRVSQALGSVRGVRIDRVEIGKAHLLAQPACEPLIRKAIEDAGYTVTAVHGDRVLG